MILSDREIHAALERGAIHIEPALDGSLWSSSAVDLRLAPELSRWKPPKVGGVSIPVDPHHEEFNINVLLEECTEKVIIGSEGYVLEPRSFHLGWTIERVKLPSRSRIAARVEGKSSLARLGLGIHITAPTIHAGFGFNDKDPSFPRIPIQLEIWNFGELPIRVRQGMKICQLILEEVHGTPEKGYSGKFAVQGPRA